MKSPAQSVAPAASAEKPLSTFIAKFDPKVAKLIRACRAEMRKLLPTAIELVYDNYNFFVIGYASTERASDAILRTGTATPHESCSVVWKIGEVIALGLYGQHYRRAGA